MEDSKSLYQICKDATDSAISKGVAGVDGIIIENVMQDVRSCTDLSAYSKELLFDRLIRSYISVRATECGYRSGRHDGVGEGVYLNKDIMNEGVSLLLVQKAKKLTNEHQAVYENMRDSHNVRFKKDCEISGQGAFDVNDGSLYTEGTIKDLIRIMLGA